MKKLLNFQFINTLIRTILYIAFLIVLLVFKDAIALAIVIGLMFISFIVTIVSPLLFDKKMKLLDWIDTIYTIVPTIAFVVLFLCSLPDETIKNVSTSVVSATIGGLLTMFGVGITIRANRIAKREDEIKMAKPYIFPMSDLAWNSIPKEKREFRNTYINEENSDLKRPKLNEKGYRISSVKLINSDRSMCTFEGFVINDKFFVCADYEAVILKNSCVELLINYSFKIDEKLDTVGIVFGDMYQNDYLANFRFQIKDRQGSNVKELILLSVLNIDPYFDADNLR